MCGRYKICKPVSKTNDLVKTNIKVEDTDNYNAHPSQKLPIIKSYTNGKALELHEWGLIPGWSKKIEKFSPLINARKETLMEKVTFSINVSFLALIRGENFSIFLDQPGTKPHSCNSKAFPLV